MKRILYFLSIVWLGFLAACQSDSPAMISLGLDDTYVVERMKSLTLHPEFSGERYEWKLSYESTAADSLVATTRDYTFVAAEAGTYWLRLNIYDATNPIEHLMQIVVRQEEVAYSPYISEVNGDNREAYRKLIVQLCRKISSQLSIVNPKGGQMPPLSSTVN